ncbi:hypothetical protein GCM10010136_09760 [Limoniibacter endophyticus]|uniref:L-ornithine N(alpha)-acyltransferase n=2 Tax=Limoniibacter endophyticus TaxID=1565040 RepID=A0A8J3GGQ6_9HYPH|nr:GNAT family N-acetyltransferase [Limoniibacter endophyticus]GHC66564.1 hypothetical protein GCM10010136_09760 [Limoniibacter endophyticus]
MGRIGSLEVRLARTEEEIVAAQRVRFRVFYEELGANAHIAQNLDRRDSDRFDDVCDHLLVVDSALGKSVEESIVGTYRLLRQEQAAICGFYSNDEFELSNLVTRHPALNFLELGRSCVLPEYRSKRTIEALWQGIWTYVRMHRIDVMTGCASLRGTVPAAHAEPLSYLSQNHGVDGDWKVRAVASRYHPMDLMPAEAVRPKQAVMSLPPLIKGYLRLGAKIGEGCVIDHDFGTVDVLIVLPVADICDRYVQHYTGTINLAAA